MIKKTSLMRPLALAAVLACSGAQAATINIINRDAAGVGFNDTTVVAPVGGNMGTTLGQQRLNVYRYVADIWAAALTSDVTITVNAGWEALSCNATTATLGSAGSRYNSHDFANAPKAGTWYPLALANKLAGTNLLAGQPDDGYGLADIKTQFNVNLGQSNCLPGSFFYLGLDGNAGNNVNFMATLLHELGHGLGFSVGPTNSGTGSRSSNLPSIWESFMYDNTSQKLWLDMTSAERKASGINNLNLAWNGPMTVAEAAETLSYATNLVVASPSQAQPAKFTLQPATFGPTVVATSPVSVNVGPLTDTASLACDPFTGAAATALQGRVAIVDRGTCTFTVKAKNAQNAGAIGVIVVNNAATGLPSMGGSDPTVTIPAVGITQADGATMRAMVVAASKYGSRSIPGRAQASVAPDLTKPKSGADAAGRPLLYAPNPYVGGSSVSHYDVSAFPNLLMEPNINADLTTQLSKPKDLTLPLLKDLGW